MMKLSLWPIHLTREKMPQMRGMLCWGGIAAPLLLGACGENHSRSEVYNSDVRALNEAERDYLVSMGDAGQGWAFEILASDAVDSGHAQQGRIWWAKALKAGDSLTSLEQAERLLTRAKELKDAKSKRLVLEEAKRLAATAIKNAFSYPADIDEEKGVLHIEMASDLMARIEAEY